MALAPNAQPVTGPGTESRIERILCPVDFSEVSWKAYRYAQSIACHYRATLVVQHVVELWQHPSCYYAVKPEFFEDFRRKLISNAENELQRLVTTPGGLQTECIVEESTAADAILSLARARAISLIVMGTHGKRGFDRLMLGSVADRVLRHAACPVLAIPLEAAELGAGDAPDDSVSVRQVLCCVDFSANSQRALENALTLAKAYDADITVLHVLGGIPESADVAKETDTAMENLQKLIPPASLSSTNTHFSVRLGKAYREILQVASDVQADVIVTGVRGRNAMDLAVFGSTTYRVIQLGRVPVVAVPI